MKRALVLILLVGGAALAEKSKTPAQTAKAPPAKSAPATPLPSLSVVPANGSLGITATLDSVRWPASFSSEEATANFVVVPANQTFQSDSQSMCGGVWKGTVVYDISLSGLSVSIPCSPLPAVPFIVTLSGIRDANNKVVGDLHSATVIPSSVVVSSQPPPSQSSGTPPASQSASTPNRSLEGSTPASSWTWLTFTNSALIICLGVLAAIPRSGKRREPSPSATERRRLPRDPEGARQPRDLEAMNLRNDIDEARSNAGKALQTANELRAQLQNVGAISKRLAAIDEMKRDLTDHEHRLNQIWNRLGNLEDALVAPPETTSQEPAVPIGERDFEQHGTLAVANHWFNERDGNPENLLNLSSRLGLHSVRATHGELSQSLGNISTFEYDFAPSPSGPWLWTEIRNSADAWVLPIDASLLRAGFAPRLLERLFEGMEGRAEKFEFRRFYRPCRLRATGAGSSYTVVERGMLQLENSPAPEVPAPATYEQLQRQIQNRTSARPPDSRPAAWLPAWKSTVSRQLDSQTRQLTVLQDEIDRMKSQAIGRLNTSPPPSDASLFVQLKRDLRSMIDDLQQRQADLERQIAVLRAARIPVPAPEPVAPQLAVSEPVSGGASAAAAGRSGTDRKSSPAPVTVAVEPPPALAAMPDLAFLRKAQEVAAMESTSEPEVAEVPKAETYVRRLINLVNRLRMMDPSLLVSVVHLSIGQRGDTFEIHSTQNIEGEVWCAICNGPHTWQLCAVIRPSGSSALVLFPFGMLGKANYSAGYSALIDDLPLSSFSTRNIAEPALLQPHTPDARVCSVVRKMRYLPSLSEGGRMD